MTFTRNMCCVMDRSCLGSAVALRREWQLVNKAQGNFAMRSEYVYFSMAITNIRNQASEFEYGVLGLLTDSVQLGQSASHWRLDLPYGQVRTLGCM